METPKVATEVAPVSATPVVPPTPTPPQDRTLELAGLQALMEQQKLREQAEPLHVTTPKVEINWSSHKKEGMRLKRLIAPRTIQGMPCYARRSTGTLTPLVYIAKRCDPSHFRHPGRA